MPSTDRHQTDVLSNLARRYIWWQRPDEASRDPRRVVAAVMNLGTWEDVLLLIESVGEPSLRDAMTHAVAGHFNARSWSFWHYRLGLTPVGGTVPPLPKRRIE